MTEIPKIQGIKAYCNHINISPPKFDWFDVRQFEDNMPTVVKKLDPFQHDLYAVGLLNRGRSAQWHGIQDMEADIIFNSPYQFISWDIQGDWSGYYILFSQEFIYKSIFGENFINRFNYFQLDKNDPIEIDEQEKAYLEQIFQKIYTEANEFTSDSFPIIEALVYTALVFVKRQFNRKTIRQTNVIENATSYHQLFSRFQSELESRFFQHPTKLHHSVTFYAQQLNVHPNYLNAVLKKVTHSTALQYIHGHIGKLAQKMLTQSSMSVKEIGYELGFEEPSHFTSFFKRLHGKTPNQYRQHFHL